MKMTQQPATNESANRQRRVIRPEKYPEAMTTAEAAAYLGFNSHTLRRWRWQKIGPPFHVTGFRSFWYLREDLDAYCERKRAGRSKHTVNTEEHPS